MENFWQLIGIMSDTLPEAPSPPAPEPGHKMMAFQWWFKEGTVGAPRPWSARAGGSSLQQHLDLLGFTCMRTSLVGGDPPAPATMKITFQKVNEITGEVSNGSPLDSDWTQRLSQGFTAAGQRGDLMRYGQVDSWTVPFGPVTGFFHPVNAGLYTVAIDFDGPGGAGKYYLDPLLRIDPETR